jgi:ABC-type transport system substrate-binding protein
MRCFVAYGIALIASLSLGACNRVINEPVRGDLLGENVLFVSYQQSPKHLDSVASYASNETPWTYAVYEPPLKYHYLKRPYTLLPKTLTALPGLTFLDKEGRELPADAPTETIATSIYTLKVKPGIRFQPHPAFAKDDAGKLLYHQLSPQDLKDKTRPGDFPKVGSRELLADDYAYAIKRLATPRISSPAFGFLSDYILGLKDYGKAISAVNAKMKVGLSARQAGQFGDLPWIDFRQYPLAGVEVTDPYTLRIKVVGKYPQFKYWLAMTFFAPVAWEVDAFYAQAGMKAKNITSDSWPVGTGPYMLTEYSQNHRMILDRNPNYRGDTYPCEGSELDREQGLLQDCGKKTPFVDRMISVRENEASSLAGKFFQGYYDMPHFERGEDGVQFLTAIEDGTGRSKEIVDHKVKIPQSINVGIWYFGFNWADPIVGAGATPEQSDKNRKLRQAISIAFDFEEYIQVFEFNKATANMGPVPPTLFGADAVKNNPFVYDWVEGKPKRKSLGEAKKLLAEAGYPGGRDEKTGKSLIINYDAQGVGPGYKAKVDWVVKQFAKLDLQVEVRSTDFNRYQDKMRKGSVQFFLSGWLADYPDAENFLFMLYGPNSKIKADGENAANYESKAFDKLFEKMKDMEDTPERLAVIREMTEIVQKDSPWMFGWSEPFAGAYQQWVYNGKPSNIIRDQLSYLRIDPALRKSQVQVWNQASFWPLGLFALLVTALLIPAVLAWRRREKATAFSDFSEAQKRSLAVSRATLKEVSSR